MTGRLPPWSPSDVRNSTHQAIVELVFAAILWGFGFIAVVWTLREIGPIATSVVRFGAATLILFVLVLTREEWRRHLTLAQAKLAFLPGLFLVLTLGFQTFGLQFTTATKSSFITTLYVLAVPILERLILKRPLHPLHWFFVGLALFGTALICEFEGGDWNIGDVLTFLCMIAASFHILWFGLITKKIASVMTFNFWQIAWGFAICLPLLAFESGALFPTGTFAWSGLAAMVIGSTIVAFGLQIRAQRVLSPSVASLIFLLESPFATLFAIAILNERLSSSQWLGGGLILLSVAAATWISAKPIARIERERHSDP